MVEGGGSRGSCGGGDGGHMDLEGMLATMAVVLVIVVEEVTVVVDQEAMETKVVDMVAVVEDMMVTMKEEILEVVDFHLF